MKGGSYIIETLKELADKRAIVNVKKNRDDNYLRWALRSVLYPVAQKVNCTSWERGNVIIHGLSKQESTMLRINLMLLEKEEENDIRIHYTWIKNMSRLIFSVSTNDCVFPKRKIRVKKS